MHIITIDRITNVANDRMIVHGSVDGLAVIAEGSTGRVINAKSEAHKQRYIEELLLAATPLTADDTKLLVAVEPLSKDKGHWTKNLWVWIVTNWKTVAVSVLLEEILRHLK